MALYVPQSRRRRRLALIATATAVVGLGIGAGLGRLSAPTVDDRVASVRNDAKDTASGLQVISLHAEATSVGAGGTDLVLARTARELADEFDRAPWVDSGQRRVVLQALTDLTGRQDKGGPAFGEAAGRMAMMITDVFAGRPVTTPTTSPAPTPTPTATASSGPGPTPSDTASRSTSATPTATASPTP
ncbi:MAG TPA: hypothetical protein VGJ14_06840 [Sporichthyaceae bacterium]|jgi:hypothetical protein